MHIRMYPQSDVDRLYWKRAGGGRGLKSVEEVVELEKASLAITWNRQRKLYLKDGDGWDIYRFSRTTKEKTGNHEKRKANFGEKKLPF